MDREEELPAPVIQIEIPQETLSRPGSPDSRPQGSGASSGDGSPRSAASAGSLQHQNLGRIAKERSPREDELKAARDEAVRAREARRREREEQSYTNIYGYMERQFNYMKRKVVRNDCASQTDLCLPLDGDVDNLCLRDVAYLLAEDSRRQMYTPGAAHSDQSGGDYYFPRILLRSKKLVAMLGSVSQQAARMLDACGREIAASPVRAVESVEQVAVLRQRLAGLQEEHKAEMERYKETLQEEQEKAEQQLKEKFEQEAATRMAKLEVRYRERELRALKTFRDQTSRLQNELRHVYTERSELERKCAELVTDAKELRRCVNVRTHELESLRSRHLEYDLGEKERTTEALVRAASAAAHAVSERLLHAQEENVDRPAVEAVAGVERMRAVCAEREGILTRALDEARAQVERLQKQNAALLRTQAEVQEEHNEALFVLAENGRREAERTLRNQRRTVDPRLEPPRPGTAPVGDLAPSVRLGEWRRRFMSHAEYKARTLVSSFSWRSYAAGTGAGAPAPGRSPSPGPSSRPRSSAGPRQRFPLRRRLESPCGQAKGGGGASSPEPSLPPSPDSGGTSPLHAAVPQRPASAGAARRRPSHPAVGVALGKAELPPRPRSSRQ
eukprot:TRINITY_DN65744_c0_g1_i1.p1 TRINITY_DN65744_c0_g1~~TRINITY_DN65744_c0_g1_i1.p1  ORF type:complete len:617 (+),score=126.13 TRINITY_DN65744_c0_g1_i1:80-1930(+)